jgi:hypothetical protein
MRDNVKYIIILCIGIVLWLLYNKSSKSNTKPDHAPTSKNTSTADAVVTGVSVLPGFGWLNALWNK